ncbi:hypothetical protein Q7P37_003023 [Cladosporium fusiforme]
MDSTIVPNSKEGESEVTGTTMSSDTNTLGNSVVKDTGFLLGRQSPLCSENHDKLNKRSVGTRRRATEGLEQAEKRLEKMHSAVRTLIECVGDDPDREGLLDTPKRYVEALLFFTKGYHDNMNKVVNNAIFHEATSGMVIVKDIDICSLCEHHLVPFVGKMQIGYMPSDAVIGLSKLPRIAEMFSRRLQIQERLTREVAHAIVEAIKPHGVIVTVESSHLCMVMRGVQQTSATSVTSCALGCFETEAERSAEFLQLLRVNRSRC